ALAAGVHHGQRALAEQLVEAAGARIEQFLDLGLRQVFEAATRSDARIHEIGNDDAGFQGVPSIRLGRCWTGKCTRRGEQRFRGPVFPENQGRISMGTLSDVIIQISTMSALVTAMQPSVPSWVA